MSVLELTVATISLTEMTPVPVTVEEDGMKFKNDGRTLLYILGGTSGAIALVVDSVAACNQGSDHNVSFEPVAATVYLIGPFPKARFDDANGYVNITPAAGSETDVMKIQAIRLP